jgi:hypothetical protein
MLLLESSRTSEGQFETRSQCAGYGMANLGIRCVRINPESEDDFSEEQRHLFAENFNEEWLQMLVQDAE